MKPGALEVIASILFLLAVLHTFSIKRFQHLALKFPDGSIFENLFHLLGEVEIVFGLWAGILVATMAIFFGWNQATHFLKVSWRHLSW